MIDTSTWKEFNMSDIGFKNFHGIRQKQSDRTEGATPLLTAGKENQGVASYIGNPPSTYIDSITVDMFGNSFFHKGVYAGDDNIYFFVNDNVSDEAKLFIAAIINTDNTPKYAFKDQFRQPQADALSVHLPATSDGQPDWAYMESYMKAVMEESEKSLENLKKADDTKHLIDTSTWKEFCVGELFSCETTLGIPSKNDLEDGDINYITRSAADNGFSGTCGNEDHRNNGNCITIGAEGFVAFWQNDDFVAGNKVYALRHPDMNEINGLFVCSALNALSDRYSFADARVLDKIKMEIIKLPITSTDEPDWQYMEDYMRSVMEEAEKSIDTIRET